MSLVRSKQRVADHGEVFTPPGIVNAMLDLVKGEAERIESRFLEPACGSGNFLVPVLQRKLTTVAARHRRNEFERRHQALVALMSIYGIELLADNVAECRDNLLGCFTEHLKLGPDDELLRAASAVLAVNIVHGDALSMMTQASPPQPITFAEWSYLGKGRFVRRDFAFDTLTRTSAFSEQDTLFAELSTHEIFQPVRDHGTLTLADLAGQVVDGVQHA
ncbi:MAG: N-6 DNA methylase [Candidatus Nanopelagicales bacterium]